MAMSGSLLATELHPEIKAKISEFFETIAEDELDKFAQALAEAIGPKVVSHIVTNAQVITSTPLASPGLTTLAGTGTVT